jgi:hypothetical protein
VLGLRRGCRNGSNQKREANQFLHGLILVRAELMKTANDALGKVKKQRRMRFCGLSGSVLDVCASCVSKSHGLSCGA